MFVKIGIAVCLIANFVKTEDEAKWVWKTKDGETKQDSLSKASINPNSRYEVFETDHYDSSDGYRPDFIRPDRPVGIHQEDGFPNRPFLNRPGVDEFIINERPYNEPPNVGIRPQQGILTGPIPSWLRDPPFRRFDTCKCAEKFNCNSPGISYGQCDVGKQYCCYARKGNSLFGLPISASAYRPAYSNDNGILVGPGGPINRPLRPHGPYQHQSFDQDLPIGRPPRPHEAEIEHTPELGVLVGPGGPHNQRPPYHYGYDRQAKSDEKN